jgi:hypothetical protein
MMAYFAFSLQELLQRINYTYQENTCKTGLHFLKSNSFVDAYNLLLHTNSISEALEDDIGEAGDSAKRVVGRVHHKCIQNLVGGSSQLSVGVRSKGRVSSDSM